MKFFCVSLLFFMQIISLVCSIGEFRNQYDITNNVANPQRIQTIQYGNRLDQLQYNQQYNTNPAAVSQYPSKGNYQTGQPRIQGGNLNLESIIYPQNFGPGRINTGGTGSASIEAYKLRKNKPSNRSRYTKVNNVPGSATPTSNPYFMRIFNANDRNGFEGSNAKADSQSAGGLSGQCARLTSLPPSAESGCCGLDAAFTDKILAQQKQQASSRRQATSALPNFLPSWKGQRTGSLFFTPRVKRQSPQNISVTIDNRITGGIATEVDEYPWTVLLKTTFNYGNREASFNCGGSVISAKYIVTAGHCVVDEGAVVKNVEIYLAEYDKRTFPRDCAYGTEGVKCIENIVMYAEKVIPHPNFDGKRLLNDIALIRLRGNAPYTDYIRPICLPPFDIDNADFPNLRLAVAGWGRNGTRNSDVKQATTINLVPQRQCTSAYSFLTRAHLCAAGYTGQDTCKGDSGGPLMMLYEGKYFLSGVVSGKRADAPCGTAIPSLYTNVYQYLDWINENIKN